MLSNRYEISNFALAPRHMFFAPLAETPVRNAVLAFLRLPESFASLHDTLDRDALARDPARVDFCNHRGVVGLDIVAGEWQNVSALCRVQCSGTHGRSPLG